MENTNTITRDFYNDLASDYKYIYVDWVKSVAEHARLLNDIIRQHFTAETRNILDASCGIGTQLIGLSELGYRLTGADISQKELDIAREELDKRNLKADLYVCGFKDLPSRFDQLFDIVIAIDNAIPHLLYDAEILEAFKAMHRVCREGLIISVRDYEKVDKSKMQMIPYGYRRIDGKNWFLFQRWEFEGEIVSVSFFFIQEDDPVKISVVNGRVYRTKFYAVGTGKLMDLLKRAGFSSTECLKDLSPQPVIIGKK